ncbi:MAG: hypothetical protein A2Z24_01915 [Candidatus Woykebacteria bacterium RBG_16_44_10]|uniref:Uncharacterized protein n=1 Tax=Candidatus Woykebacteria bacterium RBG_16_44_10 TaxID=1802597 RepID=A0A1G1WEL3_9BACT|nr:MAG: hypothetical protein A2Z24_01915 [Candidatus Woykebacteria bacterium RBG_16_44_10]
MCDSLRQEEMGRAYGWLESQSPRQSDEEIAEETREAWREERQRLEDEHYASFGEDQDPSEGD